MKKIAWDVLAGCKDDGAKVRPCVDYRSQRTIANLRFRISPVTQVIAHSETLNPWQIWRLLPAKVEGAFMPTRSSFETPEPGSLPSYGGDSGQSSTHAQHAESERDEFGTIVNEVTVVTTTSTVTTRKIYQVEDD